MKITPNQTFRHDKTTYEPGIEYDVDSDLGHYFINVGWAGDPEDQPSESTLEVDDVTNDQSPKDM